MSRAAATDIQIILDFLPEVFVDRFGGVFLKNFWGNGIRSMPFVDRFFGGAGEKAKAAYCKK